MDSPVKPPLRLLNILVVVIFFTVGFAAGYSMATNRKNQKRLADQAVTVTPTTAVFPTDNERPPEEQPPAWITIMPTRLPGERPEILAINREFKNISISFRYPKPEFCQGCYDGSGNDEGGFYFTGEIENQAKGYYQPETEDWIIQYTVKKDSNPPYGDWSIINRDFFKETEKLTVGGTVVLKDYHGQQPHAVTRLADRMVGGIAARTYESDWSNNTAGGRTRYAIFEKDGYTYLLAVMWAVPHNDYIFDLVTSSLQLTPRPKSEVVAD